MKATLFFYLLFLVGHKAKYSCIEYFFSTKCIKSFKKASHGSICETEIFTLLLFYPAVAEALALELNLKHYAL